MTVEEYIEANSTPESEVLHQLTRRTHLSVIQPRMLSGHVQGNLLTAWTLARKPQRVLELGTFTGYSAICIARALGDGATLDTIELHDELEDLTAEFFEKAGVTDKIHQHFGRALDVMQTLSGVYDMVFIDADKREYLDYYKMLFDRGLVALGSVILADNTLWDGHVIEPVEKHDAHTRGILEFNAYVTDDKRVTAVILPLRDGLTIINVL